ncbi:alpha/beta-hydrolase [Dendrothele bispora CBS 962.96]|uniref:Alpha/beta-hydrolase n=1 Tax=Dendrothele bispora (strain CBS 962.96) TaxID=1314807 RepID=A0A4S8LPA2_DENBC|nr:alpha/beta-hydrolase [Dendrothele bispora CBS 962.96]THU91001.1 alpha/beta-hydrolase [Dendrothele bispora CBS 962.96]
MPGFLGVCGRLLKHGQILCIYPAAFEDSEEKVSSYSIPDGLSYEESEVTITASDNVQLKCLLLRASGPRSKQKSQRPSKQNVTEMKSRRPSEQNVMEMQEEGPSSVSTRGVQVRSNSSRATVISFHGNGYHVWHHAYSGENFARMGCDTLLVSYRGYGHSEGRPSEKGLRRDAQAALNYVLADPELSQKPIVIHGHSLGGAVAIDLVSRNSSQTQGLIIENTFLSIPLVVKDLPFLRHLTLFIHQTWESQERILKIPRTTPILMIGGKKDDVIPEKHMRELWKISRNRCTNEINAHEKETKGWSTFSCGGIRGIDEEESTKVGNRQSAGTDGGDTQDDDSSDLKKDIYLCVANGTHADTWTSEEYWTMVDRFISSICSGDA